MPWMLAITALIPVGCGPAQGSSAVAAENGGASQEVAIRPSDTTDRSGRPEPGTAWVVFGADTVVAEVARSADERAEGLMYRDEVPDGTGMIFVFPDAKVRSFWMQNTYVPLDIAYMDASFRVVDVQQMEAQTTDPHESAAPAMFALEVRKGWLEEHGIGVGAQATVEFGLQLGG